MNIKNKLLIGGLMTSMVLPVSGALAAPLPPRPRVTVPPPVIRPATPTCVPRPFHPEDCGPTKPPVVIPKTPIIVPPPTPSPVTPVTPPPAPTASPITLATNITNRYCPYKTATEIKKYKDADWVILSALREAEKKKATDIHDEQYKQIPNGSNGIPRKDKIYKEWQEAIIKINKKYDPPIQAVLAEATKRTEELKSGISTCPYVAPPIKHTYIGDMRKNIKHATQSECSSPIKIADVIIKNSSEDGQKDQETFNFDLLEGDSISIPAGYSAVIYYRDGTNRILPRTSGTGAKLECPDTRDRINRKLEDVVNNLESDRKSEKAKRTNAYNIAYGKYRNGFLDRSGAIRAKLKEDFDKDIKKINDDYDERIRKNTAETNVQIQSLPKKDLPDAPRLKLNSLPSNSNPAAILSGMLNWLLGK
ncbi:MAG: hypothetical protein Q7S19_02395 [bacterium]|nr:hypothetical protein [bacterium]